MKNPLQNLLLFLSLCLCVLIAFQWHRETKLRQDVQNLTNTVQDKLENIQNQQAALKGAYEEIKRLDGLRIGLTETVKSNQTQIALGMKELEKSDQEVEKGLKQIEAYKGALQQSEKNNKTLVENEKTLKESLKQFSTEYGKLVANYTNTVAKYEELAKQWNAAQAAAAAAATNAPPKK